MNVEIRLNIYFVLTNGQMIFSIIIKL